MKFQSTVLTSLNDVPAPPVGSHLSISGCSIIFYAAHRLRDLEMANQFKLGRLNEPGDDRSYESKLRLGSGLLCSDFIDAGPVPASITRLLGSSHASRLKQAVVTFGQEYALSVIPFVLSMPKEGRSLGIQLPQPVDIDRLLNLLSLLLDSDLSEKLAGQAARALADTLEVPHSQVEKSWAVPGSFGMQVWNLDGSTDRTSEKRYEGSSESIKYSWEISALLSYNADHMLEPGLWRERTPQHVFNQVSVGSAFFDDHMIFVNSDCCLEMGHLPAWTRDRSAYRLENYGYDSSSIYVWTIGVLRSAIVFDLNAVYESQVVSYTTKDKITPIEHASFFKQQLRHDSLLSRAINFRDWLVEARNRALDEQALTDRADARLILAVERSMEKSSSLAHALLQVNDEGNKSQRDILLAALGVFLGSSQVPDFVNQVHDWFIHKDWLLLTSSFTIIGVALSLTGWLAVKYRRQSIIRSTDDT